VMRRCPPILALTQPTFHRQSNFMNFKFRKGTVNRVLQKAIAAFSLLAYFFQILNRLTDKVKYDKRLRPRYGEGGWFCIIWEQRLNNICSCGCWHFNSHHINQCRL
jgi:hypothetical protein